MRLGTGQSSQVWHSLVNDRGMMFEKLMEWKRKSYFYLGKSYYSKKDYEISIRHFEDALNILEKFHMKNMTSKTEADRAKLKEFIQNAKKGHSQQLKKEKSTWAKAFEENKNLLEHEDRTTSNSNRTTSTSTTIPTTMPTESVPPLPHISLPSNSVLNQYLVNSNDTSHNTTTKPIKSSTNATTNPKKTKKSHENKSSAVSADGSESHWFARHSPWILGLGLAAGFIFLLNRNKK
jgi:tetratricopeptide (TPR) repeat protein